LLSGGIGPARGAIGAARVGDAAGRRYSAAQLS
jgi:hypothetical protein